MSEARETQGKAEERWEDVEEALSDEDERGDEDAGIVGGGGPAATLPEQPGPGDEDLHRPDTDHSER